MKKITLCALTAAAVLLTACSTTGTNDTISDDVPAVSSSSAESTTEKESETAPSQDFSAVSFKTGTWYGDSIYHFKGDSSGATLDFELGIGVAFEYEQAGDGEYVFHMGAADDNTPASVVFSDDGTEAVITWGDGTSETLTYVSEEFLEPESDSEKTIYFTPGTWDGNCRYFFYAETDDGSHSGATRDFERGAGVAFEYEQTGDGEYIFHMAAADNNTPASVAFSDDGTEAVITWGDGTTETLKYVSEEFLEIEIPSTEAMG